MGPVGVALMAGLNHQLGSGVAKREQKGIRFKETRVQETLLGKNALQFKRGEREKIKEVFSISGTCSVFEGLDWERCARFSMEGRCAWV